MKKNQGKSPFFAKFLEGQIIKKETEITGGGGPTTKLKDTPIETQKYPSDSDEEIYETHKYPSDGDEYDVTMKYPSDGDEGILG